MKKNVLWACVALFAFNAYGQKSLFNEENLEGWTINGTEKWYVEDGLLICESGPDQEYGYLSTDEFYKDFVLTLEFKQEADGNSGVFFRSTVNGTIVSGWQVEVAPPNLHTGGIYESYGRGWLIKPDPKKDKHLKMGDWNSMKIKVKGNNVTTYLNGHKMIHINDEKIGKGEGGIALQIHSGGGIKVKWRNIELKEL
ncbi:MAG: secreted glycosyl hydrolase [Flavobacteriaceae bacterium]|nr:secreted glycosyl hydrolase [Flavobacteriaceae bacterium]